MNRLAASAVQSLFNQNQEQNFEDSLEHPIVFVERFWKCRDSLFVVACRVLGDSSAATEVVEACFRKTCPKPPKFPCDGAFGSWLLRVLIDEALQLRAARQRPAKAKWHKLFPNLPQAMTSKLDFIAECWCLEKTL